MAGVFRHWFRSPPRRRWIGTLGVTGGDGTGSASLVLTASATGAAEGTVTGTGSAAFVLSASATGDITGATGTASASFVLTALASAVELTGMPTITVEAAFGVDVDTEPAAHDWADLTDRVGYPGGFNWGYGRPNERATAEAGRGFIYFDNSDGALTPTNTASPFHPDVKPMTRIRIRATHEAVTYPVLEAFAENWPPQWQGSNSGWVRVNLVDGFKALSMARTSVAYSQQQSGERIGALLDAAGWPAGKRSIDDGNSAVQKYQASQRIVLNALQDTATAESGLFFVDPSGDVVFAERHSRLVGTSQATFGDDGAELQFETVVPPFDESILYNDISAKPDGMPLARAEDATSRSEYGHRWTDLQTSLLTSTLEAQDHANGNLIRYKDPRLRVDSITLRGDLFADVMTQILARTVGDLVTVRGRPGGDTLEVVGFIEHVHHRVEASSWETTWQISPFFDETYWILGTHQIGIDTVLGW